MNSEPTDVTMDLYGLLPRPVDDPTQPLPRVADIRGPLFGYGEAAFGFHADGRPVAYAADWVGTSGSRGRPVYSLYVTPAAAEAPPAADVDSCDAVDSDATTVLPLAGVVEVEDWPSTSAHPPEVGCWYALADGLRALGALHFASAGAVPFGRWTIPDGDALHPAIIHTVTGGTEVERREEVDRVAAALGVTAKADYGSAMKLALDSVYAAEAQFGPVTYRAETLIEAPPWFVRPDAFAGVDWEAARREYLEDRVPPPAAAALPPRGSRPAAKRSKRRRRGRRAQREAPAS